MIDWTLEDEATLRELSKRKQKFTDERELDVLTLVDSFHFYSMSAYDLKDALIEHARELRRVLEPYDLRSY